MSAEERFLAVGDELRLAKKQKAALDKQIQALEAEQLRWRDQIIKEFTEDGVCPSNPLLSVKRVPPKPIVIDETKVPDRFFKTEKTLRKSMLNEEMKKGGVDVPGCSWSNGGYTVEIRASKK